MAKRPLPTPPLPPATDPAVVARAFAAVAAGDGRALVLERPDEVAAVAARAAAAGLDVLHTCARGRAAPFATALDLLLPAVGRLSAGERRRAFAGAASLAEPLFGGRAAGTGEFALVHALYWLTARLADRAPLALLVEDAGHGDEPSLRLFAYLAQRIDELPVALVLA